MKSKIFQKHLENKSIISRTMIKTMILNHYYSLYLNSYKFSGDIDYQQKDFILKRLWADGKIACFNIKEVAGSEEYPHGLAVFTPFAEAYWNIYDFPVKVNLINIRGVKFIPATPQIVDEEVVIGYAQRNRKSIFSFVNYYAERMTDVLMVIRMNLKTTKMPWLIGGTPESHEKLRTLFEKLEQDDPELFIDSDDIDKFKALVSGAPYNIDKLYSYYCALENELREFLGFNNIGVNEKKEHLISAEVGANNAIVEANKNCLFDMLKEFFERVRDVLGIEINVEMNYPEVESYETEDFSEESEVEEDE